jgi:hypothetical protein
MPYHLFNIYVLSLVISLKNDKMVMADIERYCEHICKGDKHEADMAPHYFYYLYSLYWL